MVVVYDLMSHPFAEWRIAFAPLAFAIIFLVFLPLYKRQDRQRVTLIAGILFCLACAAVVITWVDDRWYRQQVTRGLFRTIEGTVTDFVPEGPRSRPPESFRVDTATYSYQSSSIKSGFHETARKGGPMRNGLHVRIRDVGGTIVRLEIAR